MEMDSPGDNCPVIILLSLVKSPSELSVLIDYDEELFSSNSQSKNSS
jgi:hypothetical protein